jgi:hypothetical protein
MRDSVLLILTQDLTQEMLSVASRFFTCSAVIYEDKVEHSTLHKNQRILHLMP